ncbi:MAG: TonB-dependent receptor [Bacteroidetes bacterium]|nr:TonB-dependent receptor [Bacteroidota bacterium]
MKNLLFILSCFFHLSNSYAIGFNGSGISGRVLDQEKKPLQFAIVTLLNSGDSSLAKGATTDENGNFSLGEIVPGNYFLTVNLAGFEKFTRDSILFSETNQTVLPDIILVPQKEMKEVTISAAQPLFEQKPDMLIMNVENSPVKISGTAWDLIAKIPGVMIDANNNITLRGKPGVAVYFDNKNTYLGGDALVNYLQNISAADVISVQIISNPSAKYDAQGTGGILNIVTKKGSQLGFNGNARAGIAEAFYPKYEGGFGFNYAKEKFNVYGKYDIGRRDNIERFYINRNIPYNNITTNYNQFSSKKNQPLGQTVRLGADMYAKHGITWGVRTEGSLSNEKNFATNTTMLSTVGSDTTMGLYQGNTENNIFQNLNGNIYFDQKLDTLGTELSASADALYYNIDNTSDFTLNTYDNSGNEISPTAYSRMNTHSKMNIYVEQMDYTKPYGKKYKLESGVKSSYVATDNTMKFENEVNSTWENDTTKSNQFIYKETILAAYANGYATYGNWQFEAGLRGEQTISDGNSPTVNTHLTKTYFQLFPSVFILQKFGKHSAMNYTYSRRVNRPDYMDLNPFVSYLDRYTYEKGNPYLQPEIVNNAEITYSFMDALTVTAGGSLVSNAMTDVTQQEDATGIGYKTTVNLKTVQHGYLGFSCPVPIGNWLMMENDFNYMYDRYSSVLYGTTIDNRNNTWTASSNLTVSLPGNLKFQAWGWYNAPATYGIFHMKERWGTGAGISGTFCNKQLNVLLNVSDIFRSNGMRATINFQNQDMSLRFVPESPRVYLRVRYSFGNSKATRKAETKTGADELKDRTGGNK